MAQEKDDPAEGGKSSFLALNSVQQRLITTALAALSLFVILVLLFGLFRLLAGFVSTFATVLLPLAIAGIVAMLLRPVVAFLEERTRLNRMGAIIILYVFVVLALAAALWLIIPVIVEQAIQFVRALPSIYLGLRDFVEERFPQLMKFLNETLGEERLTTIGESVQEQLAENAQAWIMALASLSGQYFLSLFSIAAGVAIIPVYLFFFLRSNPISRKETERQLSWIRKDLRDDILFLSRQFISSIETFFQGQILVGLIMGGLLAAGFTVAGVNFGFALGIFIGLLNIIPYLGTIIGLGTVLPIAYFQPEGGLLLATIALAIFTLVQMIEGYLLTPKIMGNRTGLHPLTIIIAIFFWGTAFGGIMGMILAIPLTAFFVVAWRLFREKYLNAWTREE